MFHLMLVAEDTLITVRENGKNEDGWIQLVLTANDNLTGKQESTPVTFEQVGAIVHAIMHPDSCLPLETADGLPGAAKQREEIEALFKNWDKGCRPIA